MNRIEVVGVVGAGQMGNGIAHVAAAAGCKVFLADTSEEILSRATNTIGKNLDREVARGKKTSSDRDGALKRLFTTTDLSALAECDLVIEAATENFGVKREIFKRLDEILPPAALLASNTSSISITKLGGTTRRADRLIGMHFMHPVPVMALVEIIRGMATSDDTHASIVALGGRMGKTPISCNDFPGFISNRVLMPMINEAIFALAEGVGERDAIDGIMKLGMNHPMGPLELADFIGLDTCLAILRVLHEGIGDPKYRPCPLLVRMVDAGWTGRKSGRGFYRYDT